MVVISECVNICLQKYNYFNIQTWKQSLVSFKIYTWFTEEKTYKTNQKQKNKKQKNWKKKKYTKRNIYETRIKSRIFVE